MKAKRRSDTREAVRDLCRIQREQIRMMGRLERRLERYMAQLPPTDVSIVRAATQTDRIDREMYELRRKLNGLS